MQAEPVTVGTTPVSLTANLEPGCYLAQPSAVPGMAAILYATAVDAPADDDYFTAAGGEFFTFTAGSGTPTWAKSAVGVAVVVALARQP